VQQHDDRIELMPRKRIQCRFQAGRFSPGAHPDGLAETGARDVWRFFRPEATAVAPNSGYPDATAIRQVVNVGVPIEQLYTSRFDQFSKGRAGRDSREPRSSAS